MSGGSPPAHISVPFVMIGAQLKRRSKCLIFKQVVAIMHWFKWLSTSALMVAISGCSSVALQNPVDADLQHPVYAELKQEGSSWRFIRLSGESSGVGEISVNLDTGKPLLNTDSEKCEMWLWNPYHSDDLFTPCRRDTFRGAQMTGGTVPGYLIGGGMTVGLGWVLGIVPLESRFLWDEYNDALAEAYSHSGLTARTLTDLSNKFDAIDALSKKSNKVCGDIAGLRKTYTSQYEKYYSERLGEHIKLQDKSGFLEKYKNVDPRDWVSANVRLPDHKPFQEDCFSNPVIDVPANAAEAGAILDQVIAEQEQRLVKVQNARDSYERLLMSGGVLDIRCNSGGRANKFVYTSNCANEAKFGADGFVSKPLIAFTITGRDFENVMPRIYSSYDSNIGIELKNNLVRIHNRTNKYVSIEAISLYFNDKALTQSKAGGGNL